MNNAIENKLQYFGMSAVKLLLNRGQSCPSCGTSRASTVDTKWFVTSLRRCVACKLLYRSPTTTVEENESFYQSDYEQGFSTDMPSEQGLAALLSSSFRGHEKNYKHYIDILRALGAAQGAKLFDFGCSWGYGSFQLAQAGYEVDSFEISRPRAEYAKSKLGVVLRSPEEVETGVYDVFFSSHVIEHVPSVSRMIETGMSFLKPGGLFVAFAPNGTATFRARNSVAWHKSWGLVHPQLIDDDFLRHSFRNFPLLITSTENPFEQIAAWGQHSTTLIADLAGDELMFAVKKTTN